MSESGTARWRMVAGIAVLLAVAGFGAMLAEPYLQNWKLQTYLESYAYDPAQLKLSDQTVRFAVANEAARLGLPVSPDQVRINRTKDTLYVEVRYSVHVDLYAYTVDLHFRPSAGVR